MYVTNLTKVSKLVGANALVGKPEPHEASRARADAMPRSRGTRILLFPAASVAATWFFVRYRARLDVERHRLIERTRRTFSTRK